MTSRFQPSFRTALALTAMVLAHAAYGQDAAPAATAAPHAAALAPPKLVTFVDAIYPAGAKAARLRANVDLELTIDATGTVAEARVVTPVGNGFDEAALEAARRFVFLPAMRGDKAISARITYRYVFELAAEASPAPATGELEGRVLSRADNRIIAGALVTLSAADGQPTRTAIADASGAFHFSALPPGRFHVKLAASELAPLGSDEEIAAGDLTSVTYRMDVTVKATEAAALEYGATATIDALHARSPSAASAGTSCCGWRARAAIR
jgi:TonB family protein